MDATVSLVRYKTECEELAVMYDGIPPLTVRDLGAISETSKVPPP